MCISESKGLGIDLGLLEDLLSLLNVYWSILSRYWALAFPVYVMVTILLALGFYIGLNFISTPPPTSLNTLFGKVCWCSLSKQGLGQPLAFWPFIFQHLSSRIVHNAERRE